MENKLHGQTMKFGKQTEIAIELIRDWSYAKFEHKFTEAFMEQYGTAPDFDLRTAYNNIQAELAKTGTIITEKPGKKGRHKK